MSIKKIQIEDKVLELKEGVFSSVDGETTISESDAIALVESGKAEIVTEKEIKEKVTGINLSKLFEGSDVTDDFKTKASTIFESAVNTKVKAILESERADLEEGIEEQIEEVETNIVESLNDYLTIASEKWLEENKIAITYGIKNEITESFVEGMRTLFIESYIDIPEEKYDLLEEMDIEMDSLKAKVNESTDSLIEARKDVMVAQKDLSFEKLTTEMVMTDREKLRGLIAESKVSDIAEYKAKLETLKESYFTKDGKGDESTIVEDNDVTPTDKPKSKVKSLVEQAIDVVL